MTQPSSRRGKPGLIVLLLALALVLAGVDQVTKYLAEDRLTPGVVIPLVGDYLGLQLIYNPGAAFSIATGMTWVLTVIMVVVIVVILRVSRRLRSAAWAVALGMLLGGAVGNLYDRLVREPGFGRGHVVDFINYNGWFVGNVADIAIVLAAVLIALLALRGIEVDGTRASGAAEDDDDPDVASSPEEELDEEPVDGEDFSPEVPQATGGDVDVASWAAGAPSVSASGYRPLDTGDAASPVPSPASPEPIPADPAPEAPSSEQEPAAASTEEPPATPAPEELSAASPEEPPATPAPGEPAAASPDEPGEPSADEPPAAPVPPDRAGAARPFVAPGPTWPARPTATPQRRPSRREIRLAQQDDDG